MDPENNEDKKRVVKKPGFSNERAKALEDLMRAKTTGIRRSVQYEEEQKLEEEQNVNNEEQDDDFIEKDEYDYDEEEELEEELEVTHKKKKVKNTAGTLPIYSFMKPSVPQNTQNQKKAKDTIKANKIDETQSKDLMDSLFDDYFNQPNAVLQPNFTTLNPQATIKASQNINQIYKSKLEASKDVYDIEIKPLKKQAEIQKPLQIIPEITPKQKIIEPIIQNEEKPKFEKPSEKKSIGFKPENNKVVPPKKEISIPQNTNKIVEEPPVHNVQEPLNQEPNIPLEEHANMGTEPSPEKMNIENERWNDINANSESLLTESKNIRNDINEILDEDGNLLFYYYDAHEDAYSYPGVVFLFGKVLHKASKTYESCCVMVRNIQRNIYLSPREEESVDFKSINQEVEELKKKHFSKFSFTWVKMMKKKKYAFELPISYQEREYFLVKYGFDIPALPHDLKGKTFDFVLGTTHSALELFMLKRKIRGPQWLLIKRGEFLASRSRKSWCPYEFTVEKKKCVHTISRDMNIPTPPLKTLAFSLKTLKHETSKKQELIIISCLFTPDVFVDGAGKNNSRPSVFSLVRKLDTKPLPPGLEPRFKSQNKNIKILPNEFALIDLFINRIDQLDPDIIIGHDLYSNLFEKILSRIQEKKMSNWSRLGRLQKIAPAKGNSNLFKTRYATVGRLLCDTYLSARELVREPDYSIEHLSRTHLGEERKIIAAEHYSSAYDDQQKLIDLIESTAFDAYLTNEIMRKLEILPLTKELTTTAGNLWIKSLQNSRAERNEMLLMHEFNQNNYIFPDKFSYQHDDKSLLEDLEKTEKQGKKKQKYAGGLVLEPKMGLYDKYILLLDFNSLYPSLIQEYNICFTTVKRPSISLEEQIRQKLHKDKKLTKPKEEGGDNKEKKGNNQKKSNNENAEKNENNENEESDEEKLDSIEDMVTVDETNDKCILPKVIKSLVDKRRQVKNLLKKADSYEEKQNLDIKQKALKLIANSIYGCLGFSSSRFYAKPLAALITKKGRDTLMKSVAVVRDKLGYEVIYGDTDSMMINSNCDGDQLGDALKIGFAIKKEINQLSKNKKLEIDIDGVFKPLLLLKKKKYAAKKIVNLGNLLINPTLEPIFVQELKGLDMVRRDWCDLSKNTCQTILDIILSGINKDEVIFQIIEAMKKINEKLKGNCSLKEFLLTKQLTKHPNDYPGGKGLPHVAVAKRLREHGESDSNLVGHFIHFLICKGDNKQLSERAYHPREFKEKEQELEIDIDYYKQQQIMPPITRIIMHIDGLSPETIAECLGLDGSRYRSFNNGDKEHIHDQIFNPDDTELDGSAPGIVDKMVLKVFCTFCKQQQIYKGVWDSERKNWGIYCPIPTCGKPFKEGIILNMISKYLKQSTDRYYEGTTVCQDENCGAKIRQIRLKEEKCPMFDCKSKVTQILQEKRVYQNFRHLKNLFDYEAFYTKHSKEINLVLDPTLINTYNICKRKIQEYLDRCVINLGSLFKFYGFRP